MPTEPVIPDAQPLPRPPLDYAPVAKGRGLRRWLRRLFVPLIVIATVAGSWYGWQWRLKQDEKEFNARTGIGYNGEIWFTAPPTAAALRHLQRVSAVRYLNFSWPRNLDPAAYQVLRGRRFPTIASFSLDIGMEADGGLKELARPDSGFKALTALYLSGTKVTDAGLKELARPDSGLKALTTLSLSETQITDAGLTELSRPDTGLKALTSLDLTDTPVTDAGLKELARPDSGLKALNELYLSGTQVTDAGLKELARPDTGLKALARLYLYRTQVTDAGLKELARPDSGLKALETLTIPSAPITPAGIAALQAARPGLKIRYSYKD